MALGLVSAEAARELYGVALTADFKVDEAETAKLARRSQPSRPTPPTKWGVAPS